MTTPTPPEPDVFRDIGHGVSVQLRYYEGELHGVEYRHPCNGYPIQLGWVPVRPYWQDGWDVLSVEPLTLAPSLLCRACQHHGFIREGRWVPA